MCRIFLCKIYSKLAKFKKKSDFSIILITFYVSVGGRTDELDVDVYSVFERFVILVGVRLAGMLPNACAAQCFWRKLRDERFSINLIPDHRIGWQKQKQ